MATRVPKYHQQNLVQMFRLAAALRKEMCDAGFTDNGGAIHSAERILNILGMRLVYPGLNHINNLKSYKSAEFSLKARAAYEIGERVLIEHVAPVRDLTRAAIAKIEEGVSDDDFAKFIKANYRLVLLTAEETRLLNRLNRSKMHFDRLGSVGIAMAANEDSTRS